TETNNHSPALFQINTGMSRMGFPCLGAWATYGLGTENQNLPSFVTMYDTLGRGLPKGHAQNWVPGFLPGSYQGTALNPQRVPIGGLLTDLKARGLFKDTLVIWGGEFGRLPVAQRSKNGQQTGRDHTPHAFTFWLAGGGARGGVHYGATDEIGHKAVMDRASI